MRAKTRLTAEQAQLIDFARAAELLGCSRTHVYDLAVKHNLRLVDISAGKARTKSRLYLADVLALIERLTHDAKAS